jgi:tagatose 6-phosphate kinase
MILCIGTTPAAQRVMIFPRLHIDAVNRAVTTLDGAAGKSINVAKVLHSLGARPLATGFLGSGRGAEIAVILASRNVQSEFIRVAPPARQCITVIDQAGGTVTELVEESRPVEPAAYTQLAGLVEQRLGECRAVIMSGSLTPGGPVDFYRRCTELARRAQVLSCVDAQGASLAASLEARPGLIKPNRLELAATVARELSDEQAALAAMRELHERGAERVVVTSGKGPVLAFDGAGSWRIHPPVIQALNPIGSGDAFTAALVWRLLTGDDLGESCRWGTAAGAANALTPMPGDLDREQVEKLAPQVRVEKN